MAPCVYHWENLAKIPVLEQVKPRWYVVVTYADGRIQHSQDFCTHECAQLSAPLIEENSPPGTTTAIKFRKNL